MIGLLLGLGALAVLLQAVIARHWGVTASSALGLLALAFASVTGSTVPPHPCPAPTVY